MSPCPPSHVLLTSTFSLNNLPHYYRLTANLPLHAACRRRDMRYAHKFGRWQCAPCVDHHRLISIHSTLSLSAFLRTARLLHSACACFSCIFFNPHPHITRSEITAGATRGLVGSRFDRRFRGPAVQPPGYAHVGQNAFFLATLV
jgi:hypothetical protein